METTYVKSSPAKCAVLAVLVFPLMAGLLIGFIYMTYGVLTEGWVPEGSTQEAPLWGWPLLLLFGVIAVLVFYQWLRILVLQIFASSPRLTLDSDGLNDRLLGVGPIAWDDITEVVLVVQGLNRTIVLHLTDRDTYIDRRGAFSAMVYKVFHVLSGDKIRLYSQTFDRSTEEVANLIVQYRNASLKLPSA